MTIKRWTTMFDLDTSILIVGHVLVAVCVEDLPYWWHLLYATSLIMPVFMRFQLSWLDSSVCQTFPAILEIMVLCISSSWRFWSMYIVCGDDHICDIMYYAYSWPLYSYVSGTTICTCRVWSFYCIDWMVGSSTGFFITSLLGWTYNVFRPSYDPSELTH